MAESKKKVPMSLNERSQQRLFLASARAAPSINIPEEERPRVQMERVEGRRRLFKLSSKQDDKDVVFDKPNFAGIMDFDSPPLAKTSDEPSFLGIIDFDLAEKSSAQSASVEVVEDRFVDCVNPSNSLEEEEPSFLGIMNFDLAEKPRADSASNEVVEEDRFVDCVNSSNPIEEEEHQGAEFEGRENEEDDGLVIDEGKFSGIRGLDNQQEKSSDTFGDLRLNEKGKVEKSELSSDYSLRVTQEESLNQLGGNGDGHLKEFYDCADQNETEDNSFADFPMSSNTPEKEKPGPQKVKLEGRRRLCKVSSKDDDPVPNDVPNFSVITDFGSPQPQIRDILDELSLKLEYMSIEKKRDGKIGPLSDYSHPIAIEESPSLLEGEGKIGPKKDYNIMKVENVVQKKNYSVGKTVDEAQKKDYSNRKIVNEAPKKDYSVKKTEKSVLKESFLAISDDDEDPYIVLGSMKSISKANPIKKHAKSSIFTDSLKDSGTAGWDFEDGESIILSGKSSNYTLPGKIAKMLYPHQRNGLRWLWSLHCKGTGGILGDDMGLGKTMQICSFLAGLFHSGLIKRVMIVAPKTLLTHWIKELTTVGLSKKIKEYYGACAKARLYELQYIFQYEGILLTTYDIVRNNFKSLKGDFYFLDEESEDSIWDYTILDEGHIIKNPSTQRAKSLLKIPSGHRIIISGTPIQNNLKELWALFSFCCPELLGDKKEFRDRYEHAILRGNDKNATDREMRVGSTVAKELRDRIEPYFLRRLKSEVFSEDDATNSVKLSKKNEIIVWLRLTQCQRHLYEAFLNSEIVLSSFDGSPLAALTVLKKICDHPYLLTKKAAEDVLEGMETMVNQDDLGILEKMALHLANSTDSADFQNLIDNVSCKITFILALLDKLIPEGHNVLIFSQTRKMLNYVQEAIISRGYKFLRIDGTTKIIDREKIVNDFQEGKGAPIFLLTSQVGGLGLTLTKADRVIVVDPAWNPSTDNQSVDRAYRIGQKKDVLVYRLMTCGTIEEKIYKMQVFKGGLFKTATEQKEQMRYFSQQDLRELFTLPKEGFDVSVTQQQLDEEHDQHHIMDDSFKKHIEFLKSHGIAGVSHHSLLFSKTAPAPVSEDNDEVPRKKVTTFAGRPSSSSSLERNTDGSELAVNPKDVEMWKKNTASGSPSKLTESEIRERIQRLRKTYANKGMISMLPDKGEKLKRQIADLNLELENISMAESGETEIIDLDDISGKFQRIHI